MNQKRQNQTEDSGYHRIHDNKNKAESRRKALTMAFYMNPAKRFSDSITLTAAPVKTPKNTRESLLYIRHNLTAYSRLKKGTGRGAVISYDRCYTFTDISYVNKDDEDKANVLSSPDGFLKGNEYII